MIPKRLSNLFFIGFFLVVFSFVLIPDTVYAQPELGCCVNQAGPNSNCVGCGSQGSSCQSTQTGACPMTPESDPDLCPTAGGDWSECFVAGAFCYQETNNTAVCQPSGCCQIAQGDCYQTNSATCATNGDNYLGDGSCLPQFDAECSQLGCCQTPGQDPQMCQTGVTQLACEQGGGAWTAGVSCDGNFCGQAPPPTGCCETADSCTEDLTEAQCDSIQGTWTEGSVMCDGNFCGEAPIGCCQVEAGECIDVTEAECSGTFFEGGMCPDTGFCEPPPVGCCICGLNDCLKTTELECENMECKYQGDSTCCANFPEECDVEPEGCCVLPENPGLSLSHSLLDIIADNCVIETESQCNAQGGDYKGDGISCDQVPECMPISRNVPTLGQWGLIVVAGLLGIYSLVILRRRNKYNLG